MFRRDEKDAADREARQAERARERERRETDKLAKRQTEERRKAEEMYWASPVGRARQAREAGARFFQIELDVQQVRAGVVSFTGGKRGPAQSHADVLGQIESVGWRLEHVGYVFIQTEFMTGTQRVAFQGQDASVGGTVQGVYLFRAT